ncbi:MAG: hypothetical protein CM15mP22_7860 [Gammaproteobacteria bacterium]|nr:MAG: hypothetical protein CM15mP22_7860 [Gammaproteobacteria bacterium]
MHWLRKQFLRSPPLESSYAQNHLKKIIDRMLIGPGIQCITRRWRNLFWRTRWSSTQNKERFLINPTIFPDFYKAQHINNMLEKRTFVKNI